MWCLENQNVTICLSLRQASVHSLDGFIIVHQTQQSWEHALHARAGSSKRPVIQTSIGPWYNTSAVEMSFFKKTRFFTKKRKSLKSLDFRFLRSFRKNLKKSRFQTPSHSRKLLHFSLISCVYSYAIVCT